MIPVSNLVEQYRVYAHIEESTAAQYAVVTSLIEQYLAGVMADVIFEPERFSDWVHWLRTTPDRRTNRMRTGRTINGRVAMAKTLWAWCFDRSFTPFPVPTHRQVKRVPESKEPPTAWSLEEMGAILAHTSYAPRCRGWSPAHWRALLSTFWDCGSRVEALLLCRTSDLSRGQLHLRAENDKEDTGKYVTLRPDTVAALESLPRVAGDDRLFTWDKSICTLRRHYRRILKAAGLRAGRRDLFQRVRRTVVTHVAAAAGVEQASRFIGHAHVQQTLANYIDPTFLPRVQAADVLPPLPR